MLLKLAETLAQSTCDWLEDRKWLISLVRHWKWVIVSSRDRGSFSPGPKILGKKEGRRRPRAKLASVTVRGPPRKSPKGIVRLRFTSAMHICQNTSKSLMVLYITFPIAGRSWMCTGRLRSNNKHPWPDKESEMRRQTPVSKVIRRHANIYCT